MTHISSAPLVTACANSVLDQIEFFSNPYFKTLVDGSMHLEQFRASQEQFFFAVKYFARPMAALISRMPDPITRLDLLHNVVEEHGDFVEQQFHKNTFTKFLESIGGRSPDASGVLICPAVHAFNNILMAACMSDEVDVGICCLGIIEQAFSSVSALIAKAVVQRGWVTQSNLVHYALHAELDVVHAEEFFKLVEPRWDKPEGKIAIQQGLNLGGYAFDQLYRSLGQLHQSSS